MSILSSRDVNFIKLKSLKKDHLVDFCKFYSIQIPRSKSIQEMIKIILITFDNKELSTIQINKYIKNLYLDNSVTIWFFQIAIYSFIDLWIGFFNSTFLFSTTLTVDFGLIFSNTLLSSFSITKDLNRFIVGVVNKFSFNFCLTSFLIFLISALSIDWLKSRSTKDFPFDFFANFLITALPVWIPFFSKEKIFFLNLSFDNRSANIWFRIWILLHINLQFIDLI